MKIPLRIPVNFAPEPKSEVVMKTVPKHTNQVFKLPPPKEDPEAVEARKPPSGMECSMRLGRVEPLL